MKRFTKVKLKTLSNLEINSEEDYVIIVKAMSSRLIVFKLEDGTYHKINKPKQGGWVEQDIYAEQKIMVRLLEYKNKLSLDYIYTIETDIEKELLSVCESKEEYKEHDLDISIVADVGFRLNIAETITIIDYSSSTTVFEYEDEVFKIRAPAKWSKWIRNGYTIMVHYTIVNYHPLSTRLSVIGNEDYEEITKHEDAKKRKE